ncbi:MAG: aminotransferase class IV [Candidatus Thermoplasmatota archaeon]
MSPELGHAKGRASGRKAPRKSGPEALAYVDGDIVDLAKARVPLNDRGYLLGDGIFETLRVANGRVFRPEGHSQRLRGGLRVIGLDESVEADYQAAVKALLKHGVRAFGDDLYLRVNVSTGPMGDIAGTDRGLLVTGIVKKFKPYPMQYYSHGIQVIVSKQRKDSRSPVSGHKTLSYLPHVIARREAHSQTAHDALLLNENGRVAECSTSNVFALKGDKVYAPGAKEGACPGITRDVVLDLLADHDFEVVQAMTLAQMRSAKEAWLTNTTGGIVPITRLGDKPIGNGKKGELTAQLSHAFEALVRNHV